jgi:hypothetical protein
MQKATEAPSLGASFSLAGEVFMVGLLETGLKQKGDKLPCRRLDKGAKVAVFMSAPDAFIAAESR